MSGGKDLISSSAISGLLKAIASQRMEWPFGSVVLPETSPPWSMIFEMVATSPSTTACQTTSGAARYMPFAAPWVGGSPCPLSFSSCSACMKSGTTPSSLSGGWATLCRSRASNCRMMKTSGVRRTDAMVWSRSAETRGMVLVARRSMPASTGIGPCLTSLSRPQATKIPSRALTTTVRGTLPSLIALLASSSHRWQFSRMPWVSFICCRTLVGQPMFSSSAFPSLVPSRTPPAKRRISCISAGCIRGFDIAAVTASHTSRTFADAS
mmetsp:Transcript_13618/g.40708  ORF Transcript_13618/g.40708 Transcript_13618/m.40708 type:complete len:267 (-) Transcript_13618:67-867(-)